MISQMTVSVLPHVALAAQFCLGIVFLLSALPKLRHPLAFVQSVVEYRVLPEKVARVFALVLIPLEALLPVAFFASRFVDVALRLAAVMLIAFLVAIGINLKRHRRIRCGCFGEASEQISLRTIARLILLLSVVLLLANTSIKGAPLADLGANLSTFTYLLHISLLAMFLIMLAAWTLSLPELVALARQLRTSWLSSG